MVLDGVRARFPLIVMKLHFELITPERVVVSKDVDSISLPTPDGEITILPNHIPLVSLLVPGELVIRTGSETEHIAVSNGFLQISSNNVVNVLVDTAETSEEIQVSAAEEAKERARAAMKSQTDRMAYLKAKLQHEKSLVRLKVAKRRRPAAHVPRQDDYSAR